MREESFINTISTSAPKPHIPEPLWSLCLLFGPPPLLETRGRTRGRTVNSSQSDPQRLLSNVFGQKGSGDVPVGSLRVGARWRDAAERAEARRAQQEVVSQTDTAGAEPIHSHGLE